MSELKVFNEFDPRLAIAWACDAATITAILQTVGVRFEQWQANANLPDGPTQAQVLDAYASDIARLKQLGGYQSVDVVSMVPNHPEKATMRTKFLDEHIHSEDEVRFFVGGQGLFSLHIDHKVYEVLCTKGDLLNVPANTRHWFDMGPNPCFTAIRMFINPEGWVAKMTLSDIAQRFTRLAA